MANSLLLVYCSLSTLDSHRLATVLAFSLIAEPLRVTVSYHYKVPMFPVSSRRQYPHLELLSTGERRGLVRMVRCLLEDWPEGFISFCKTYWLSLFYREFIENGDFDPIPFWFWRVIHDRLTEFEYRQSYEEHESELAYKFKNEWGSPEDIARTFGELVKKD